MPKKGSVPSKGELDFEDPETILKAKAAAEEASEKAAGR